MSLLVQAADPTIIKEHRLPDNIVQREAIRHEMFLMLADISALAKTTTDSRMLDNDLNQEQGRRILEGIEKVKKLDSQSYLHLELKQLKNLTNDLLRAIDKKQPTITYSEKIFSTCFSCHQKNIQPNQPALKK